MHAGFPSVQREGVGDVLFGVEPPAARLVQTIYPKSFADQISIFDQNLRPGPSEWPRPDCTATAAEPTVSTGGAALPCTGGASLPGHAGRKLGERSGAASRRLPNGTNPGRTHRFYTDTPVLPFGYGLSYTSFEYELIEGAERAHPARAPRRPPRRDGRRQSLIHRRRRARLRERRCAADHLWRARHQHGHR